MMRRRFFIAFRRKYVEDSIKKRKGKCKHCSCCEVRLFGKKWNCKHYDLKNKKCEVYNSDKMPKTCFYYPFDEKDKWDEFKERCGFFWNDAKGD